MRRRRETIVGRTLFRIQITRDKLAKIRTKAIRKGVWFRILNRAERALIELTIKIVKRVRSLLLTKVLISLVTKLLTALEGKVGHLMRKVGQHLAKRISLIAQSWGHVSAYLWKAEHGFVRYLTVMYINAPGNYKLQGET